MTKIVRASGLVLAAAFVLGVLLTSYSVAGQAEGLKPSIYSHPLSFHGHAAGPRIGPPDRQGRVPGMGDYQLFADTCYAIELGVAVVIPEWGKREIQLALEQYAVFTSKGVRFLDGRQTEFHLIK